MYLQGFQPSESSLKLLFILCEALSFLRPLSSLGLAVQPRSDCLPSANGLGQTTVRPWLDNCQALARQLRPQKKSTSRRMKSSLSATFFRLLPLQNRYSNDFTRYLLNKICNGYILLTTHPPQWHNVICERPLTIYMSIPPPDQNQPFHTTTVH